MSRPRLITLILVTMVVSFSVATPSVALEIFIVGDSTASAYGPERYPRMGWGQVLGDFYADDINVIDLAKSGRSARSFIDEGLFADLEKQIGADDLLLIQFGHNDQKIDSPERYAAPATDYKSYLRKYIEMARAKGATPVLLTSVVRRKFEQGKLIPTHGEYPGAVRDLAVETGTMLIDMTQLSGQFVAGLGEEESKAIYLHYTGADGPVADNTHFSERGAYAMAALVAKGLDDLQLAQYTRFPQSLNKAGQDGPGEAAQIKAQRALSETGNIAD